MESHFDFATYDDHGAAMFGTSPTFQDDLDGGLAELREFDSIGIEDIIAAVVMQHPRPSYATRQNPAI